MDKASRNETDPKVLCKMRDERFQQILIRARIRDIISTRHGRGRASSGLGSSGRPGLCSVTLFAQEKVSF